MDSKPFSPNTQKLLCLQFVSNSGDLRFKMALRRRLFVTNDLLLKRLEMYGSAWPFLAL